MSARTRRFDYALPCALLLGVFSCGIERPDASESNYPTAGLYTPRNTLGASDPTDTPTPGMGLGNRCEPLNTPVDAGVPATTGTLTVNYTTRTTEGRYAPKNCAAVWIETADERYVATIEVAAALRKPGLVYWQDHACTEKLGPDVVTSATLRDHDKPHTALWQGLDLDEALVADGSYRLFIEVTETDKEPGFVESFDFIKGPMAFAGDVPVSPDGALQSLSMSWEPSP